MNTENSNNQPIQKIIFGSPGTGKSYKIRDIAKDELGIEWSDASLTPENIIKTVFHPEYTYSDFVGKLLPQSDGDRSVIYKFYEGHFLTALGLAYKELIDNTNKNVMLVIDELNRGNATAIFGSIFQLLDREEDNWSSYEINLSELEMVGILRAMKYDVKTVSGNIQVDDTKFEKFLIDAEKNITKENKNGLRVISNLTNRKISIPCNLSIIATINTSDESIYYLDSAFKRRWDWEYMDVPNGDTDLEEIPEKIKDIMLVIDNEEHHWFEFIINLNEFIKFNYQTIRRIEDKQIGWWFLKSDKNRIDVNTIKNKLMFYLWDSVFSKDKRPLEKILSTKSDEKLKLITYADFIKYSNEFISAILEKKWDE